MNDIFLGIDVGSATAKVVVLDRAKNLLAHTYLRANGRPRHTLLQTTEILARVVGQRITYYNHRRRHSAPGNQAPLVYLASLKSRH